MPHPCPGVVVQSSLPSWTTKMVQMSPKLSAQTNSPYGNRLRRTPHLGCNTVPNRRSVHNPRGTPNVPSQLRLWPTPVYIQFPFRMVLTLPPRFRTLQYPRSPPSGILRAHLDHPQPGIRLLSGNNPVDHSKYDAE